MSDHPHVLVATLGGQPQIVTFTLDLLVEQGFPITDVFVIHPKATERSRLAHSLLRLSEEFTGKPYSETGRVIRFHSRALELDGVPIEDICDDPHSDGTLNTIHHLIGQLKRQGYRIHLSVTGGRRLMSLLAIPVALFNFDRYDHIWHLYTPDAIRAQADAGTCMHVPLDAGIKLLRGPFIPLGAYAYDPAQPFRLTQEEQLLQIEAQERKRCMAVENQATPAQKKVLRAFARGLRPQQVAHDLCITLKTVNSHKTVLLDLCRQAWDIPSQDHLDYHFLSAKFTAYFPGESYK
jgi:CRISPR-associated protein Csx14